MRVYGKSLLAVAIALSLLCVKLAAANAQDSGATDATEEPDALETLFAQLQEADEESAGIIVQQITGIWSHSGSASIDLLLERGKRALDEGNHGVAVAHFSAAIDHAPDFAEAYNGRAAAFFQMREFSLSVADIRQVLALNPRHFGALEGLGQILVELDDPQNALIAFSQALALNPQRASLSESVERLKKDLEGPAL